MIGMKNRSFLVQMLLLLVFTLAISSAQAAERLDFWVSPDGEKSTMAISWYTAGKSTYILLPGNADPSQLKIGFSGADSVSIDGQPVHCGDSASMLVPGQEVVLSTSRKQYTLKVRRGSPNIPALYLTTESGSLDYVHKRKGNKEAGTLVFVSAEGTVEYDGALTHIKIRGNSSTTFAKKNYQIKLAKGADLCHMGKSKTWILTGNYRDKSMLRNQITLDMARYSGLAYTPEHIPAEVYINHEYMGLYLFSEKIMIDEDRIAIRDLEAETESLNDQALSSYALVGSKAVKPGRFKAYAIPNNPEDITGGYLVEYEAYASRYKDEPSSYHTKRTATLVVKSPEYCSEEQMTYISGFMQSFENAIFAKDGIDPASGRHYSELVDMDSLVKKYLLEEISKNYDGNNSSMFFYKPSDAESTKAFAGPAWDYDSSYGSYAQAHNARKLVTGKGLWIAAETGGKYWWPTLYKQPDFFKAMTQTYASTFRPAIRILLGQQTDPQGRLLSLDAYADSIRDSVSMTLIRWPRQKKSSTVAQTGYTFEENIEYLRTFLTERLRYLDSVWMTNEQ